MQAPASRAVLLAEAPVRIVAGDGDDVTPGGKFVELRQRSFGTIEQRRQRSAGARQVPEERPRQCRPALVAPFAVGIQPLDAVDRNVPVLPGELGTSRERVGGNPEAAQPGDVLRHRIGIAAERVRRRRQAERHIVSLVRADFDAVHTEHAVQVFRRLRRTRAVAVVREDGEVHAGLRCRQGDLPPVEGPIGLSRVDVKRASQHVPGGVGRRGRRERTRWSGDENNDGGREGRRHDKRDQ